MSLPEAEFDRVADAELHTLERAFADFDPDEIDAELSSGVLTLTLADDQKIVINSHRAARQIWMAAFRTAWHFTPDASTPPRWRTEKDELRTTLAKLLSDHLKRPVAL